ncbi:MAG: DNA-protecting protein DprA [Oscillospiraceae bacterium]|nr:DNA-protecting protein DprA [Oscillospiraceae bacterium]
MASTKYWVWLSSLDKLRPNEKSAVLELYGDPEKAFFAPRGDYRRLSSLRDSAREELEKRDLSRVDRILDECDRLGLRIVSRQDAAYPKRLKNIYAPPAVLYMKGRQRDLDSEAAIAVIGTRRPTGYGLKMARSISAGIVHCGGIVLSGLGPGIDGEAARAALEEDGCCVGVLGTSHDQASFWLNDEIGFYGLLISEYAPGTASQRHFFRERNRITAGLSVGVVVIEAPEKSGALLFAEEALEQGKEIFALPGNVDAATSVGTNSLIQSGAKPITCAWDVMTEFTGLFPDKIHYSETPPRSAPPAPPPSEAEEETVRKERAGEGEGKKAVDSGDAGDYIDWKKQLEGLSTDQLRILTAIEKNASHIDDIVEETGLNAAKVLAQLTVLEIKGFIRREAGMRIALKITKK